MKRPLLLIAVLLVGMSYARPASAQYGIPNFGGGGGQPLGEEIQEQRKKQMSQQQEYSKPRAKPAVPGSSAPRSALRGSADSIGRVDLSGRATPGYPTIRDRSLSYSTSRYSRGHRVPVKRPAAPKLFPGVGTPRRSQ